VLPICYRTLGTTTVSGIDDTQLAACRQAGLVHFHTQRFAPAVDLAALTTPFLDTVSANARSQIRRACKIYGATPHIQPAASLAEAHTYFDTMVGLHQASWQRRGQTGAFANTAMRDFHRTLIERAWPVQQADMLRIVCGARDIGYLYNFLYAGRVYCYQSGFIPAATPHEKPGLVCHSMAIAHYAAAGFGVYDMLGGASRYKTTLARQGQMLHWITLYPKTSLVGRARIVASKLAGREKLLSDARTGT
jgi:CelD/BcsL family acetyltransferase involved in cellulose biosynthesis